MKAAQVIFLSIISGIAACGGGGGSTPVGGSAGQNSPYQGVWTSSVNGETYEIDDDTVRVYQHDGRFCLVADTFGGVSYDEIESTFALSSNDQILAIAGSDGTADLHAPIVWYTKVEALPDECSAPIAKIGDSHYQRDVVRDFDLFGRTFSRYYSSFELKQVDWESNFQTVRAHVNASTTDAELLELLYQLTMPLADAHVQVRSERLGSFSADGKPTLVARIISEYLAMTALSEPLSQNEIDALNAYIDDQLSLREDILLSYADDGTVKSAANGEIRWFSIDAITYLHIGSMSGFGEREDAGSELQALEDALDRVLRDTQDAEGLIIDVRSNNGGRDFLSMAIASRFVSGETLGFSKQSRAGNHRSELEDVYIEPRGEIQYLGPIALLTSNSTVSAAEVFTLMMRSLPNVTLIGESTQGALSDSLEKMLPNGFEFSLSNQVYFSAEGEWFEHVGIPVDIEMPFFSLEERETQTDLAVEAAYRFLLGRD